MADSDPTKPYYSCGSSISIYADSRGDCSPSLDPAPRAARPVVKSRGSLSRSLHRSGSSSAALARFASSGAGLALIPRIEGESLAARGELVRVLPEYDQQGATASLVWPASRHLAPRVRAFIDHAVETMGDAN